MVDMQLYRGETTTPFIREDCRGQIQLTATFMGIIGDLADVQDAIMRNGTLATVTDVEM